MNFMTRRGFSGLVVSSRWEWNVDSALIDIKVGTYKGLSVEAKDISSFINNLINQVISDSSYSLSEEEIAENASRIEQDLRIKLKTDNKPPAAFCYLYGITEDELYDYCAIEYVRGRVEDSILLTIARQEGIIATETDITLEKALRKVSETTIPFDDELDEESIYKAVLTKKILQFLMEENSWIKI